MIIKKKTKSNIGNSESSPPASKCSRPALLVCFPFGCFTCVWNEQYTCDLIGCVAQLGFLVGGRKKKKEKQQSFVSRCFQAHNQLQIWCRVSEGEVIGHRQDCRKVIQPLCPGAGPKINATHRLGDGEHHHKWSLRPWKEQGIIWTMSFLWQQCNIPFFFFFAKRTRKTLLVSLFHFSSFKFRWAFCHAFEVKDGGRGGCRKKEGKKYISSFYNSRCCAQPASQGPPVNKKHTAANCWWRATSKNWACADRLQAGACVKPLRRLRHRAEQNTRYERCCRSKWWRIDIWLGE